MELDVIEYKIVKKHSDYRKEVKWVTGSGTTTRLMHMDDSHLVNLILYLNKKKEELLAFNLPILPINGREVVEWLEILNNELKYRKLDEN